jgi:hypothetical protein
MQVGAAPDADKVDLIGLYRAIRARRLFVLIAGLLGAVVGFGAGLYLIKSRADSFLQLSYTAPVTAPDEKADKEGKELRFRTNIAEYKVLNAAVLGRSAFLGYATKRNLLDPALLARLDNDLAKDNSLARWVRPVFAIARTDLRDIPDQQRDEANYLVGVEISVDRRSPEEALAIATALGDFVRDSAILLRAREFAAGMTYKASNRLLELDRQAISTRLALTQAEQKQKELAAIRDRYPDATRGDVRQVISVDRTTSRFLPPVAQLVGAESQIAEIHENLRITEWESERAKALLAFLEPAQVLIRDAISGAVLFPALDGLMAATFDAARLKSDPWRDAYNTLSIEIFGLKTLYFERMRFIAGPALNEIPLWLRLLPALAGLLLGVAAAVLAVLVRRKFANAPAGA